MSNINSVSKSGWYLFSCSTTHETVLTVVLSQSDIGGKPGCSLLVKPGRKARRVVYLRAHTGYSMSATPADEGGSLSDSQWQYNLKPISVADGWYRLWLRVCNLLPEWHEVSFPLFILSVTRRAGAQKCLPRVSALQLYEATWSRYTQVRDYSRWVEEQELSLQRRWRAAQPKGQGSALSSKVCFILPFAASYSLVELQKTLSSLLALSYGDWRCMLLVACMSNEAGAKEQNKIRSLLAFYGLSSKRVDLLVVDEGSLGVVLDAGLELLVSQDSEAWFFPLLPGDQVASESVQWISLTEQQAPDSTVIFADEDRLTADGRRHRPWFKTAWNMDAFLSGADTGRAVVIKARMLKEMGGFARLEDNELPLTALLYRILLQLSANVDLAVASQHLPVILLHVAGSAGLNDSVFKAEVVNAWLTKKHHSATATPDFDRSVRIKWTLPTPEPMVSLLIPTRDHVEILRRCIDSILILTDYPAFEVIVLDNQSSCPQTLAYLKEVCLRDSRVRVLYWNYPFNFAAINNFGARYAKGSILGLVNNDIEPLNSGWLTEMVSQACRPEIGCVGAKLYYPNGRIQHSGVILGVGGIAGHVDRFAAGSEVGYQQRLIRVQNISAVTAACMVVRRELFERVGGMNEQSLAVNYNDVDLCLKVQALGYRNLWNPYAELIHHESVSRGTDHSPAKHERAKKESAYMRRTWGSLLNRDPAYNPNLTLVHEDFSLRVSGD